MSEEFYDKFENLTPTGSEDVSVVELIDLLKEIPEPTEETLISIKILKQFETASALVLPKEDGISIWLGYCVGAYHESPREETFFLFALKCEGELTSGYATNIEDNEITLPKIWSERDKDLVETSYFKDLLTFVQIKPTEKIRSEWFSPILQSDSTSVVFKPNQSAPYFIRQQDEKILFVQPALCGGWYGELWRCDC